jgi:DnaJ homolog subfamily B member 6
MNFAFSDPFDLFDSVFPRHHPFLHTHHHRHRHNAGSNTRDQWESPFQRVNHFHSNVGNVFAAMERDMMSDFNQPFGGFSSPFGAFPSMMTSSNFNSSGGSWASEGFMSTTINGVTHTMHKRRDWDVSNLFFFLWVA